MSISQTSVVEYVKNLKLGEVKGLVSALEEELGVKATAPIAPIKPPDYGDPEVEQTEFDVMLLSYGDRKINVIKVIREATGLGLKDSKVLVDAVPTAVREGVDRDSAEALAAALIEAGGSVEIK